MKKVWHLLVILSFSHVYGQNTQELFSFVGATTLNPAQQLRYEQFVGLDYVDSVKIITVSAIASIQNNGK